MNSKIIDGKAIAKEITEEVTEKVSNFKEKHGIPPTLSVILVGDNSPSKMYIKMKEKAAEESGIEIKKNLFEKINEKELLDLIEKLNNDKKIHGIIIQLPLPKDINEKKILLAVSPEKDVDGFHALNAGNILIGDETLVPCTPLGIIKILEKIKISIEGKNVVIVNHSNVIGKPLAMMLLNRNATVSICHVKTRNLKEYTKRADILITATGVPGLITKDMVKEEAVVIDAGIEKIDGEIRGDVDFEAVKKKASFITPVPGGIGPMTVAMVLSNTLVAAENQILTQQIPSSCS